MTRPALKAALLHLADDCQASGQLAEQALLILVAGVVSADMARVFMDAIKPMMRAALDARERRRRTRPS
jgi:uncharacterized metal-binding protein